MQQVKFFTKVLLLSLFSILPIWQTTAFAGAADTSSVIQQMAVVNINTASAETLSNVLTGVGMMRAEAIVAYREANGEFTSIDQLLNVTGIGEKILEKNHDRILLK
jgi:competence protein ComEA